MSEVIKITDKILEYVNQYFLDGNELVQVSNYQNLLSFMSKNDLPCILEPDEYETLLDNPKVSTMVDILLESKDRDLYCENLLFLSLATIYASSKGINLDLPSDMDFNDSEIDEIEKRDQFGTIFNADESSESFAETEEENETKKYYHGERDYVETDLLKSYLRELKADPYTPDQELEIFKRYAEGETQLRDDIYKHNLRLVVSIAKRYVGLGVEFIDLIQEGNIGLNTAIDRYDYKTGNKFSTYAYGWIRQGIVRCLSNDSRTIRIPVHLNEIMYKINRFTREYKQTNANNLPTNEEIAKALNIPVSKVEQVKNIGKIVSLNEPVIRDGDADSEIADFIEDTSIEPFENNTFYKDFRNLVFESDILTPREAVVLKYRFGFINGKIYTLEEVGKIFHVTRERIRQIEVKALRKLKKNYKVKQYGEEVVSGDNYYLKLMQNQKQGLVK